MRESGGVGVSLFRFPLQHCAERTFPTLPCIAPFLIRTHGRKPALASVIEQAFTAFAGKCPAFRAGHEIDDLLLSVVMASHYRIIALARALPLRLRVVPEMCVDCRLQ